MFIARFCDLLEVEVNCDGCNVTLAGRRYRCLQYFMVCSVRRVSRCS